ncbi:MAG: hypothetical protein IJ224_00040 [Lachnospiraceae bacterium]|nr:hypothetical protein [Lachnospiraceae bacterium]
MKKVILWCSAIITMSMLLTACSSQQGALNSTDNITKTEEYLTEQKTEELPDIDLIGEETKKDEQDIDNNDVADWSAITVDGVNEELFAEKMNIENLEYVAYEIQTLVEEEYEDEIENPEILLTQGWTRVFNNQHYKNVIAMGDSAMMPLYWIIYKSSNSGEYEYICANALYELSGYDFSNADGTLKWTTSKELLELFNAELLNEQ